jgi:hypothetical protein
MECLGVTLFSMTPPESFGRLRHLDKLDAGISISSALAYKGTRVYGNVFDLIHYREPDRAIGLLVA